MTIPNALSKKPSSGQRKSSSGDSPAQTAVQHRSKRSVGKKHGGGCSGCCYSLVGLVIVSFAIAGTVVYRQYQLDYNFHVFHDGDQVLAGDISNDLNSVLCSTYTVTTNSPAFVYLTDGPARISSEHAQTVAIRSTGLRALEEFDYGAFYLLPGSVLEVGACMSVFNQYPIVHAEVLFIQGDDHFEKWRNDASCSDCVDHRGVIPPDALCEHSNAAGIQYVIGEKDTYYVIITRQRRAQDGVAFRAMIDMKVMKTVYDTSNAKEMCVGSLSCRLNLTYDAHDDVIVQFPFAQDGVPDGEAYFTTSCQLRKSFWITVFVLVPAGIIALLTICCCVKSCCDAGKNNKMQEKKKASKEVFATPAEKKQPLQNSGLPPV